MNVPGAFSQSPQNLINSFQSSSFSKNSKQSNQGAFSQMIMSYGNELNKRTRTRSHKEKRQNVSQKQNLYNEEPVRSKSWEKIKKPKKKNNKYKNNVQKDNHKLEILMERRVECGKPRKSGQAWLYFECYVSKSMVVAIKKFKNCPSGQTDARLSYQRELQMYQILNIRLPQIITKLISSDDGKMILETEKELFDLNHFLQLSVDEKFITEKNEIERFILQFAYGMINIIEKLGFLGILHGDVKADNIVFNHNVYVGKNYLIIKIIDWGLSISFDPKSEKDLEYFGGTKIYCNSYLSASKNKEQRLANEYWCLSNTILTIIEKFNEEKKVICKNFGKFKKEKLIYKYFNIFKKLLCKDFDSYKNVTRPKLEKLCSSEIIDLLDSLFSDDVLLQIPNLKTFLSEVLLHRFKIKTDSLYDEKHGYLIDIQNINAFTNEICELNPLLKDLNESTYKEVYKKAFRFTNIRPSSNRTRNTGKKLFIKCLTTEGISKKYVSKCFFQLGIFLHFQLRRDQLFKKILKFEKNYLYMFPEDFKNGELLKKIKIFVDQIQKSNIFKIFKDFAMAALEIQKKLPCTHNEVKARYYDLASLAFEMEGNYKEAFSYEKKHLSIWNESKEKTIDKKAWKFQYDIDYSKAQMLKFAFFLQLEDKENLVEDYLKLKNESDTYWGLYFRVYQLIFSLKNENKVVQKEAQDLIKKSNEIIDKEKVVKKEAQDLIKELNETIDKEKVSFHPLIFALVDLLENIYQLKFFEQKFLDDNIRSKPLFSVWNFEIDDQKFLEDCQKVYEELSIKN